MDWLWQGLIVSILAALGGTTIAFLRKSGSPWATPVLYGLGASALIGVALTAAAVWSIRPVVLSAFPSPATPDNIEKNVREWLDHANVEVAKLSNPETYFTLRVRFRNNHLVVIDRPRSDGQSLVLKATTALSEAEQATVKSALQSRVELLEFHLRQELARANVTYSNVAKPFDAMTLEKRLPIRGLDEYTFRDKLDQVDFGVILVLTTIGSELLSWQKTP